MSENKNGKSWLAAYLYYVEPWEEILVNAVKPFIKQVMDNKWAERYFFIRYWERGPHIRLRFFGDTRVLREQVKPRLDEYFENYYKEHPTTRKDAENIEDIKPEFRPFPNNSVQYIEYEPEVPRYGGPVGILIGERQFQVSSDAVLEVIRETGDWDYDRALGAAIQMHLGFAYALGMDLKETAAFYSRISTMWFSRAYAFQPDMPKEELQERQKITMDAFKENFEKQKETLVPYHRVLWEAFNGGAVFEQDWLNQWIEGMKKIKEELHTAQANDQLVFQEAYLPKLIEGIPQDRQLLWLILESYIHMTNNRLGILNRDEAYLGYLIRESLKEI